MRDSSRSAWIQCRGRQSLVPEACSSWYQHHLAPGSDIREPGRMVDVDAAANPRSVPDVLRRRELAAFLRSRRERIAPQRVGLPGGGRRRTPGLRREEVANLAGVGVTWYTWLEQGRDIRVSEQVLDAIGRTLQLDGDERAHLFVLAGATEREV